MRPPPKRVRKTRLGCNSERIDSGDQGALARRGRAILDAGVCRDVTIFASGNLDEHRVGDIVASGAPVDGFGVGARMNTSADAPLDCAYKLQEYDGVPRRKRSRARRRSPDASRSTHMPGSMDAAERIERGSEVLGREPSAPCRATLTAVKALQPATLHALASIPRSHRTHAPTHRCIAFRTARPLLTVRRTRFRRRAARPVPAIRQVCRADPVPELRRGLSPGPMAMGRRAAGQPCRIDIATTNVHLPRRIGEALKRAHDGELDVTFGHDEYSAPVHWKC